MIKLLVSDVDGTLLPYGESEISEQLLDRLTRILDGGVRVAIASGRSLYNLRALFAPLAERLIFIAHDGALTEEGGAIRYHKPIAQEEITRITRAQAYRNAAILYSAADRMYTYRASPSLCDRIRAERADMPEAIDSPNAISAPVYKITVVRESASPEPLTPAPFGVRVCSRGVDYIEYVARFATKGSALTDLQMRHFLMKYDTAAIGDAPNDIPMLREAGVRCAVPGARPEVIAQAGRTDTPAGFFDAILSKTT